MNKVFGIDLGTTYSCIAYIDDLGKPVVLQNAEEERTTPSVVYYESATNCTVGKYAKEEAIRFPYQTVSLIKREMGQDVKKNINGTELRPEEISAAILKKVVQDATNALREEGKIGDEEEIKDVVITCPAYFGMAEKDATKNAGKIAGLNVLSIINEPTAAAICYGVADASENKTVMVYDLGGGTFDITVIHIEKGEITVVVTGGNSRLGGADWDEAIIKYVADCFEQATGTPKDDLLNDPETLQNLSIAAENAKKTLTPREKANITVNYEGDSEVIELTREKFNEITKDLLEQTIVLTEQTMQEMEKKGYVKSDISEILLVGGSSRMPQVKERVKEAFGIDAKLHDPNEAVAKGAAIYAENESKYIMRNSESENMGSGGSATGESESELDVLPPIKINDVSSRTYGTEIVGEKISNIIMRNEKLPMENTKTYGTVSPDQRGVEVEVYESLSSEEKIEKNLGTFIGKADLQLPSGLPKGAPIEVTFKLNVEGLLEIKARELSQGNEVEASFDVKGGMSSEEVEAAASTKITVM